MSKLTTLHLALQCNEQAFVKILKYLGPLQELVLSIAHPSPSWQDFLESLVTNPSGDDWVKWTDYQGTDQEWTEWCSSQTLHANILRHLKYLGLQCLKRFSQPGCLDNLDLLHVLASQVTPPQEHLRVWEGRVTTDGIAVGSISASYLEKYLGTSDELYDSMILRTMATQSLVIHFSVTPLFKQLHPTVLFRQLQDLHVSLLDDETHLLPPPLSLVWHPIMLYSLFPSPKM